MKHCAPNNLLVHMDGALLAILLFILNQLTKFVASIYNNFQDILFTPTKQSNDEPLVIFFIRSAGERMSCNSLWTSTFWNKYEVRKFSYFVRFTFSRNKGVPESDRI